MPSLCRGNFRYMERWTSRHQTSPWLRLAVVIVCVCVYAVDGMTSSHIRNLRHEVVDMFYHGFDNYMENAFPEDELRPISCTPLFRDRAHPENIGLNDVLGNYSLTLIDSLSTLAILASSPSAADGINLALDQFQQGVRLLVENYGDGTTASTGQGTRARGFDLDSKVQVFETVIRGVGGLLSAHLFAVGELPIRGYRPHGSGPRPHDNETPITWSKRFVYNGQLLRLAHDLATRLLPAFYTPTGIPYPRVNLRHGIPFYLNSPANQDPEHGKCHGQTPDSPEITETCSAGAGSLVLEFSTLSRLTGDDRFETLAKRAFWEVWNRRSSIGLIGAGIDAESGLWTGPTTGIGAGIDSFFEYALKSHILLSGLPPVEKSNQTAPKYGHRPSIDPNDFLRPLTDSENSPSEFLATWQDAHASIKRHLYRDLGHPHYVNAHITTGSPQAYWIDSLSAYFPGLLTLSGELNEAIETNLLYTALWTRYSALPERWSTRDAGVEGGLGWWPGRPEFIESNYHIYRATKDPWYLHVGEMVLKDINRRCRTKCGWAGLQDVRSGELSDRMESFFLGETAKYLYLLFDEDHPLNRLDAPFVFTTEGHPLIVPRAETHFLSRYSNVSRSRLPNEGSSDTGDQDGENSSRHTCPPPPPFVPLTRSATAARPDIFHAASLTRLHLMSGKNSLHLPSREVARDYPRNGLLNVTSPTNYSFYPWTLPQNLVPSHGISTQLPAKYTFDIQFPANSANILLGHQSLTRVANGLLINALDGVRIGLILEDIKDDGTTTTADSIFRVQRIASIPLGRDEKVFIKRNTLGNMVDPNFTRVRDLTLIDLVLNVRDIQQDFGLDYENSSSVLFDIKSPFQDASVPAVELTASQNLVLDVKQVLASLLQRISTALGEKSVQTLSQVDSTSVFYVPANGAVGIGAAPISDVDDIPDLDENDQLPVDLPWTNVYIGDDTCQHKLPDYAATEHQVIVMRRGSCSFSKKLRNIPSFTPSHKSLRLVIVVSDDDGTHIRPLLDEVQRTPSGLVRPKQIPMVMVGGGDKTWTCLKRTIAIGLKRRYHVHSQGTLIGNLIVL